MTEQIPSYIRDRALAVGDVLYGYCGGMFGRDSYEDKRIEARGRDWVVCRDDDGNVHFSTDNRINEQLVEYLTPEPKYD